MMYAGRVFLGFTDEQTLRLTPRYYFSQLAVHLDVVRQQNGKEPVRSTEPTTYIDQIPGW